jgi:cystathionine beta-lyase/cystathionine gamma-synthase
MTSTTSAPQPVLGPTFASDLVRALPRMLAALPDDWDHRATTYDLMRFDSAEAFSQRFERALVEILGSDAAPEQVRERLAAVNLPFDYARLGQPLSTVFELYTQARTQSARCFSFASVTKPWLAVVEAPGRIAPVRIYADATLPISDAKRAALRAEGCELHEGWTQPLPPRDASVLTVFVTAQPFAGVVTDIAADAVCFPVRGGGMLAIRDTARIAPASIQLIRKRTISALLAADARAELERIAGAAPTPIDEATEQTCATKLRALFPQIVDSLFFCTGLAAEDAVFAAVGDVLGPTTFFYAQNGYGGTGQLISELLARSGALVPRPLQVIGQDASGRPLTLVDRVITALGELGDASACVFLETPTNPELQAHDFEALMRALRARRGPKVPVIVDTTLAPLFPIFAKSFAHDWPFILVKSGSKYFTKGKATLGIAACAAEPTALAILKRARERGRDADSFARPSQLAELSKGLGDLVPRMATISRHTIQLAAGLRRAFAARGHDITLYAITEDQVADGLASGMLSFYLPPAPTTHPDLVDEFVAYLLEHAPSLVKSRVSYGQSTGEGRPDVFYVINPEESTQGALSAEVKNAQKRGNVQICRISVPEHGDVDGLLAAMEPFFTLKYGSRR